VKVTSAEVDQALDRAAAAIQAGKGLGGTGFWSAVAEVKRDQELVDPYADRIAEIDQAAFEDWVFLRIPFGLGTILAVFAVLIGLALLGWAVALDGFLAVLVFGAGVLALLGSTHGLAHLAVGAAVGMRFTGWFVGEITQPQPGVKIDYSTYLRTPARQRAWMHASGAIATKLVPFLALPAAIAAGLPWWVVWVLGVAGVGMVITDALWSTKSSDWKKFQREMEFAQES
jgi:hypothetical protein